MHSEILFYSQRRWQLVSSKGNVDDKKEILLLVNKSPFLNSKDKVVRPSHLWPSG